MNPLVAILIAQMSCHDGPLRFRDFYRSYYFSSQSSSSWMGAAAEETSTVIRRVMDATADFQDYRAAWAEKCRP